MVRSERSRVPIFRMSAIVQHAIGDSHGVTYVEEAAVRIDVLGSALSEAL